MKSSLNAHRRRVELSTLAEGETVDVLVVGLGVTGAGIALDAASRGLSVAAVDAHDLASGTSRWSSKLVHGGLRYLAHGDVAIAYESAVERGILMQRTAPHLVRALPMLLPLTPGVGRGTSALTGLGFFAGDQLRRAAGTSKQCLPSPRTLTAAESLFLAPGLRTEGLRGGRLSWDGQLVDDARLVTAIARTAAGLGAKILTRCRATQLRGDSAEITDTLTGDTTLIRARATINAAGVWSGELVPDICVRPSRGTHIVLRSQTLGGLRSALTVPVPGSSSRFVFALPQPGGLVYAGLTDEPVDAPVGDSSDSPEAPESDVAFLLDTLGSALREPLPREAVIGTYAGYRPLLDAGTDKTADLSRRHAVLTSADGVTTVVGGKLTTYRRMAEDGVDAAVRARGLSAGPSRTAKLPLVGAAPRDRLGGVNAPLRLVARYGTEAAAITNLCDENPELAKPVSDGSVTTRAELVWGLRHELALDENDLLDRRTRVGLVPADRTAALPAARWAMAEYGTPSA